MGDYCPDENETRSTAQSSLLFPKELLELYRVDCEHKLGEGAFGVVFRGQSLQPRKWSQKRKRHAVALKCCTGCLDESDVATLRQTYREIAVLRQLQHDHIIVLRDALLPPHPSQDVYLVFDLMKHDLAYAIRWNLVDESQQKCVIVQTLRALQYLHAARLLHRDIKPANILLDTEGNVKLGDFGFVRYIGLYARALTTYVSMRWYRAPEIILGSTCYEGGVDIWALGCVAGEMILGRPLLPGVSSEDQIALIVGLLFGHQLAEDDAYVHGVQEEAMTRLTAVEPEGEILEKRLRGVSDKLVFDFVSTCLRLSPDERPSARELLLDHALLEIHRKDSDGLVFSEVVNLDLGEGKAHAPHIVSNAIAQEVASLRSCFEADCAASCSDTSSSCPSDCSEEAGH